MTLTMQYFFTKFDFSNFYFQNRNPQTKLPIPHPGQCRGQANGEISPGKMYDARQEGNLPITCVKPDLSFEDVSYPDIDSVELTNEIRL